MQGKHLFEYAVIRVMPRVEREEFINVGVILYCAKQNFLQTAYTLNKDRLLAFSAAIDIQELEERMQLFQQICKGGKEGGSIGQLPMASRFRWLTSSCSTIVQTSPVHPGLCDDSRETLDRLLEQLVL
ncbi:DUF3037 domain-containing protein [Catalinimonas niigatensis]|uniref:DUF3037 domain-containing protein n=1 Tax=Catalinimonas niigatensis TaxID=1397264 RepID=UPI002665B768|nr:DUF3037 domain-containing protein [Catalinimonas niigatensis]WPP49274.1 DUF3037 domain-containing protein [Catalinimonas niigatensis]